MPVILGTVVTSHTMNPSAYYLKSLSLSHSAQRCPTIVSVRYALLGTRSIVCSRKFAETET